LSVWGRGRVLYRAHALRFDPAHGRITFGEYAEAMRPGCPTPPTMRPSRPGPS